MRQELCVHCDVFLSVIKVVLTRLKSTIVTSCILSFLEKWIFVYLLFNVVLPVSRLSHMCASQIFCICFCLSFPYAIVLRFTG